MAGGSRSGYDQGVYGDLLIIALAICLQNSNLLQRGLGYGHIAPDARSVMRPVSPRANWGIPTMSPTEHTEVQ